MDSRHKKERLSSIDALRGADMFFVMGGAELVLALCSLRPDAAPSRFFTAQMTHADWHGLIFYDFILPLFLFVAGLSVPHSLDRRRAQGMTEGGITRRLVKRCIILILLGLVYNGFRLGWTTHVQDFRFVSVLGRLGVATGIAAHIFMRLGWARALKSSVAITLLYWLTGFVLPGFFGDIDPYSIEESPVLQLDRLLIPGRLYGDTYDPEGIITTIPSVVTVLAGMLSGSYLSPPGEDGVAASGDHARLKRFSFAAAGIFLLGLLWSFICPVNKTLWTASFTCITAAISMLLFALFYYLADVRGYKRAAFFFVVIGMNSVTVYFLQVIVKLRWKIAPIVYRLAWRASFQLREVIVWCVYILIWWLFLYVLYRRRIFLKV